MSSDSKPSPQELRDKLRSAEIAIMQEEWDVANEALVGTLGGVRMHGVNGEEEQ